MDHRILIIDDDLDFVRLFEKKLRAHGFQTAFAATGEEALQKLKLHQPDLLLLDMMLPDRSGVDLVRDVKKIFSDLPIIMISGHSETHYVVSAMQAGASDYIIKPIDDNLLWDKIIKLIEMRQAQSTLAELEDANRYEGFLGKSPRTKQLLHEVGKIAHASTPALIRGELGSGKSFLARLIHEYGPRRDKPFITVNCSAIPDTLLESELFGVEKSPSLRSRIGKWEMAHGGTLFIDEVGDLLPDLQVKILRALQGGEFERVGGSQTINAGARIIASSSRNLEQLIQERKLREDLFYRLNILPLSIPPLRARQEDIPILLEHFIRYYSRKMGKNFDRLPEELIQHVMAYAWPGNTRELQSVVELAILRAKPPMLTLSDLVLNIPELVKAKSVAPAIASVREMEYVNLVKAKSAAPAIASVREMEYVNLVKALEGAGGNISKTAKALGIGRDTVYRRLRKYKLGLKRNREWN